MTEPRGFDARDANPETALAEADRLHETVRRRSSLWYVRYLTLAGIAILVIFPLYALPGPWAWVAFGIVWGGFVVAFWFYERSQQIRRRRSQRRVLGAFVGYFALVLVLIALGEWAYGHPPGWWFPVSGVILSLPFFVGAYLEFRESGMRGDHG